jgi:ATP-dependent DNA helicase RecQ
VLVYRPGDLGRAGFLAGTGQLTLEDVVRAHASLRQMDGTTVHDLQDRVGLGRAEMLRMIELLKAAGVLAERRGRLVLKVADFDPASISLEKEESRHAYERSRLEMMRAYAELRECRRRYILNYFGEDPEWERCGWCDVDVSRTQPVSSAKPVSSPEPFGINDAVVHATLGPGVVQRVSPDSVTVLFEKAGYKTLDLALVLEQDLLEKTA